MFVCTGNVCKYMDYLICTGVYSHIRICTAPSTSAKVKPDISQTLLKSPPPSVSPKAFSKTLRLPMTLANSCPRASEAPDHRPNALKNLETLADPKIRRNCLRP